MKRDLHVWVGVLAFTISLLCLPARMAQAADAECDDCHGANGVSQESDIPTIAGLSEFVLEEYMFEYRDEARICRESEYRSGDTGRAATTMCEIAAALDDDAIGELAQKYSSFDFVAADQEFDAELAAEGASIHRRACEKCHTDGGSYADDDAGLLAGQWTPYLRQALTDFLTGDRDVADEKMAEKIEALDDAEIEALLSYYASQQ